jgi:DNA polymerase-3 subunit epsilon
MNDIFVAIDFETADRYRDSACSLAMVRVESGEIVHKEHRLIILNWRKKLITM